MIPIQSSKYSILSNLPLFSIGVLFVLCVASLGKILYLDHFSRSCGFVYVYSGQSQVKSSEYSPQSKEQNPLQAEQGHA
jgi:hypothetical protein